MRRFLMGVSLLSTIAAAAAGSAAAASHDDLVRQGRYVVSIAGCNDCHTAGFAPSGGKVPEAQWLLGDKLGFAGPWGTTYPANLRLRIGDMDLATFKAYARTLTTRPPMPYWAVNAMSDHDIEALWTYVKSLGAAAH
jgi:mono/diheme cytochrome c family protein